MFRSKFIIFSYIYLIFAISVPNNLMADDRDSCPGQSDCKIIQSIIDWMERVVSESVELLQNSHESFYTWTPVAVNNTLVGYIAPAVARIRLDVGFDTGTFQQTWKILKVSIASGWRLCGIKAISLENKRCNWGVGKISDSGFTARGACSYRAKLSLDVQYRIFRPTKANAQFDCSNDGYSMQSVGERRRPGEIDSINFCQGNWLYCGSPPRICGVCNWAD